jgi:hypothetical protein
MRNHEAPARGPHIGPIADSLLLPPYKPQSDQPRFPCTARVVVARTIPDEHGDPITYRVRTTGEDWWVSATLRGFRASAMLHTVSERRATIWMLAIKNGMIGIGDAGHWPA